MKKDDREPTIYISPKYPSYDFKTAAEGVPSGALHDIFLRHEAGMTSIDPSERWGVVDAMKVMSRQNGLPGVQEYRQAALGILEKTISADPDANVRQKAVQTASIIRGLQQPASEHQEPEIA
ncbi:MAG: hypothetical protein KJ017_00825 [Alphaproteobacteria bacterium]|nr:hypothetical protein [Alphaproteobacteria bacterium]